MSTVIVPDQVPEANEDCIVLRQAFADIGCDKKAVIDVVCHRNQEQRSRIRHIYQLKYEENLLQRLKSELHGDLEKAVVLWMCDPAERDATIVYDALKGLSKDTAAITEVLYPRTSSQIVEIIQAYNSMFGRSLEEDIALKTSGDTKKILLGFLRQDRSDVLEPDMSIAEADARDLVSAFVNRNAIDRTPIIRIFSTRNSVQLTAALDTLRQMYGHSAGKVIKQTLQGSFRSSLMVAMKYAKNSVNYFAKALYLSMKGLGTDDSTLTRIIVRRADIDMRDIKAHFAREYGKTLQQTITSDTSGHYKTFLLLVIGTQQHEIQSGSLIHRLSLRK